MQGYGGTTTWSGAQFELYSRPDYNQDTFIVDNFPDLIVCEYGHNDYSLIVGGQKTESEFITQYRYLLDLLSQRYPGIPIVIIIPFAQRLQNAIKMVADTKPYYYLVQTYDYDYATLDGTHPSAQSGTDMAENFYNNMLEVFGKSYFM